MEREAHTWDLGPEATNTAFRTRFGVDALVAHLSSVYKDVTVGTSTDPGTRYTCPFFQLELEWCRNLACLTRLTAIACVVLTGWMAAVRDRLRLAEAEFHKHCDPIREAVRSFATCTLL